MSVSFLNQAGSSPKGSGTMERERREEEGFSWELRVPSWSSFGSIEGNECVLGKEERCFTWVAVAAGDSVGFFVDFLCHNDLPDMLFESLRDSLRETASFSSIGLSSSFGERCWLSVNRRSVAELCRTACIVSARWSTTGSASVLASSNGSSAVWNSVFL